MPEYKLSYSYLCRGWLSPKEDFYGEETVRFSADDDEDAKDKAKKLWKKLVAKTNYDAMYFRSLVLFPREIDWQP